MAERELFSYEGFKAKISEDVAQRLGGRYKVCLKQISRNNSVWLDGLIVMDRVVKCASPGIYLNRLYDEYLAGREAEAIAEEITECVLDFSLKKAYTSIACDYETVKDRIICRLINHNLNENSLEELPHVHFLDFAVTFHIMVCNQDKHIETIQITNRLFETFGVSVEELYAVALANTERLMTPYICPISVLLKKLMPELVQGYADEAEQSDMYVLSNRYGIGGAVCLIYTDIMSFIDGYGIGSCIILPSSIHEVILLKTDDISDINIKILADMVKEVNATQVLPDEILSGEVYFYSKEEKRIFKI